MCDVSTYNFEECHWIECTEWGVWLVDFLPPFASLGRAALCEEHKDAYEQNGAVEVVAYVPHEQEDLLADAADDEYTRQKEEEAWNERS